MATIKIKRSGTSSQTPNSLDTGELAINYHKDDGFLFWKDTDGTIKTTYLKNAPLNSPVFTGSPETTVPPAADDSNRIPTTSWVQDEIAGISGGAGDVYKSVTDGTTTANASGATDTLKFRAGTGLTVAVGSNDGTHGDNVLYSLDSELQALAGVTAATNALPYFDSSSTATTTTLTSTARSLLDDTSTSAMRTTLELGTMAVETATDYLKTTDAATTYQPLDATLTALAGATTGSNKLSYWSGTDTLSVTDLSSFGRTLIDDADASAARSTLSLGTMATEATTSYYTKTAADAAFQPLDSTLTSLAVFNSTGFLCQTASSTFVARSLSAGSGISISNSAGTASNPIISLSHLGLQNLSDPNANRLIYWNDNNGQSEWLALGSGLTISSGSLVASGGAVADGCVYENSKTISSNYTMSSGKNGMSAGPISIASSVTVTIPSGSRWSVI